MSRFLNSTLTPSSLYTDFFVATWTAHLINTTGSEAKSFLESQTTQVIHERGWNLHGVCDRAGKLQAYFLAKKLNENTIQILVSPQLSESLYKRLNQYLISEDAVLEMPTEVKVKLSTIPLADSVDNSVNFGSFQFGCSLSEKTDRSTADTFTAIETKEIKPGEFDEFLRWAHFPSLGEPQEIGILANQTLFLRYGVDFKKGCFPGQETVAKIFHNRGAAWSWQLIEITKDDPQKDKQKSLYSELTVQNKTVVTFPVAHDLQNFRHQNLLMGQVLRDYAVKDLEFMTDQNIFCRIKSLPLKEWTPIELAQYFYEKAQECFHQNKVREAQSYLKICLRVDPTFWDAYEVMGVILGRDEKFQEAIFWIDQILEKNPHHVLAHTNKSLFLMRLGQIELAEKHKQLAANATFKQLADEAKKKRLLNEQAQKEAEELKNKEAMFKEVLEIDPEDAMANNGLGEIYLRHQRFELAQMHFEKSIASHPTYSVSYLGLGKAYRARGLNKEAEEIWKKGITIAAKKGEMMPANEMQSLLGQLK
jgi:folate-binding Fe-S cluster repair protein YgfZ/Tfp pilus assembly protein PilF